MNENDRNRMKELLQKALPPMEGEPERDLWPAMLRRLDASSAAPRIINRTWLDWALLAGLVAYAALFPASIPVFLYYL
ncbi:MAG: hypothetical protein ABSE99_17675 [Terracidiphilus sp.]|jgi:hypothetical protein